MEEKDELKPCPFCGGRAILRRDSSGCYVKCNNGMCKVMSTTWYYDKEDEAITAWNRRANDDTTRD